MKKILTRIIIIISAVILLFMIISSIYVLKVYIEFVSNKTSIFSKIEDFSISLGKNKETDITLGFDETSDGNKNSSVILDRNGNIITKFASEKHKLVPLKQLPYFVPRGFVLVEDRDFYEHGGINLYRLTVSFFNNIVTLGHSGGGSTISQQLAKILFTKHERKLKRKIYEMFCVFELEKKFTKNEILEIYLNSIYMGPGIYGIESAANYYFGKNAGEMNIAEASILIGMNRSVGIYSPIKNRVNAANVQKTVLNQFVEKGFITKQDAEDEFNRFWARFDTLGVSGNQSFWKTEINRSGYITEYVRQILESEMSYEKVTQGGLIVETTIDLERQSLAEKVIKSDIKPIRDEIGKTAEKIKLGYKYTNDVLNKVEGALVSIDYKTGEILVIVGGSGYSFANQFNRAVNARRQIGSSVKPFIYSVALNEGKIGDKEIHPFSKFKDEIIEYNINGKKYSPKNYHFNHVYGNTVTLYDALKTSLNTVAVQVMNKMEIKKVADFIRTDAFLNEEESKHVPEVLSLALGTCELSPLELAAAYSIFPRGGKSIYPVIIKKISDTSGNIYYDINREKNPYFDKLYPEQYRESKEVLRPEISYELTQMMKSVFEKGGTAYWSALTTGFTGTGYGKSGTSQDYKDGWFAGFNDREVAVSWVGIDSNESILFPSEKNATIIWCDYMKHSGTSMSEPLEVPENMKLLPIDMETGLVATKYCPVSNIKDFYFWKDGPKPEECYIHQPKDLTGNDELK
jgi:membrane carboxypeptidase/penicillin-binding protein